MGDEGRQLTELDREECLQLLGRHQVGRLALVHQGRPVILPVNYVFDGERVAFRTGDGSLPSEASLHEVAFEIDGIDEPGRTGWSVLVQGVGFDVTDSLDETSELVRDLPVDPWVPGSKPRWIRIDTRTVTGRRLA